MKGQSWAPEISWQLQMKIFQMTTQAGVALLKAELQALRRTWPWPLLKAEFQVHLLEEPDHFLKLNSKNSYKNNLTTS